MSDKKSKDPDILAYLQGATYLLVEQQSNTKNILRKLLASLGGDLKKLTCVATYAEAEAHLTDKKPLIVFSDYKLGEKNGLDLHQRMKLVHPSDAKTSFILISENSALTIATRAAEEGVDGVLIRPFTYDMLERTIVDVFAQKAKPTDFLKLINQVKVMLDGKKFSEAIALAEKTKALDPKSSSPFHYQGLAHMSLGDLLESENSFRAGINLNPGHYQCTACLLDLLVKTKKFSEAYALGSDLSKKYAISAKRIPTIIYLAVQNKKYEDLKTFYELFSQMEELDEMIVSYLTAGLVVSAKFFLRGDDKQNALDLLKKAERLCGGKKKILAEIFATLQSYKLEHEASAFLARCSEEVRKSPEMQVAHIETLNRESGAKALQLGHDLIKSGVFHPQIYVIMIQRTIELQKNTALAEDLARDASKRFPDQKDKFESLLRGNAA